MRLYLVPVWFYSYSILFEVFFAFTTLLVAWYALKLYKVSEEKHLRRFGIGFLLISISYSLLAFMNISILTEIKEGVRELSLNMSNVWLWSTISVYAHALFYVSGIVAVAYATLKIDSRRTFLLIWAISVGAIFFCSQNYAIVYIISAILILFIVWNYFDESTKKNRGSVKAITFAFVLLFLANIEFALAENNYIHYVVKHVLELAAYIIILLSLIKVINHGEKTKQA